MSQVNKKRRERTTRAEETELWVQAVDHRVTFADDENYAAQTDPSFETKWNTLMEQYHAARKTLEDSLQEIENKMWELKYSSRMI
ncbi:hypothetical protein N0V84_000181 [Fusarium piperis]|uniref:Uncharacterized protein n=1 Tax=Fusarium piperis TaxID=1435070 RepID=A0A9W9BVD8_9HYPO|nr:hypothetical protein N0V84_000181 [Fusarium piperis]